MAPDDNNGARPAGPVVLRIKLRYDDVDAMVHRFASNVGKSGLFLPTKSIQPIGTEVKFELRLANDSPVLVGLGRVKHVKHYDPANPKAAFGMAIELMRVSREGREVIIRMLDRRRAMGLPDVAIPVPEDIDAARRSEVETQPRGDTSGVVRDAMTQFASAPVGEQVLAPGSKPASGPIAIAKQESDRTSTSGPIAMARDEASARVPVPVLAPEPSRPKRPRVQDLIAKAAELSGPIIAATPVPDLDMHVDLDRVLSRARALAGGELEVELATLREAAAAPLEISVEAASAELARQLGGTAIAKRERSARWEPPPPIETRAEMPEFTPAGREQAPREEASPEFSAKTRAETEAAPSATIAAVVQAAVEAQAPVDARVDEPLDESSASLVPQEAYVIRQSSDLPTYTGEGQAYRERLGDHDDAGEPTRTPTSDEEYEDAAFVQNASTITPADAETLPPRRYGVSEVKTDPAAASMMIDDDADVSSFERALDAARVHTGVSRAAPERLDDRELEDDQPAELLASGEYQLDDFPVESTHIGEAPVGESSFGIEYPGMSDQLAAQLAQQLAEADAEAQQLGDDNYGQPDDPYGAVEPAEEISDHDVLAEADEQDADLLGAHGEAEAPPHDAPEQVDDFAARLDLGDDDDMPPVHEAFDREAAREFDAQPGYVAPNDQYIESAPEYASPNNPYIESAPEYASPRYPRGPSANDYPDPPSSSYTFAENFPQAGLHFAPQEQGEEFDEPHGYNPAPAPYAQPPAAMPEPEPAPAPPRRARRPSEVEEALAALPATPPDRQPTEDLEDALAALDVDLGDLPLDRRRDRRPSSQRPLPGLPLERPRIETPPVAAPVVATPRSGPHTVRRAPKGGTKPPPIPAAARKQQPSQQQPVVRPPSKRAVTDDGILIDFDDDE